MSLKRRFGFLWLASTLAVFGASALFNRLVDPYGLYPSPRWSGVNAVKARPDRPLGDIKLVNALRMRPEVVILGNSRADIGLDPAHPALKGQKTYNLAVPGSAISASARQLETLLAAGIRPRLLIIGVDFFDYLDDSPPPASPPADDWDNRELRLRLQGLFTLASLGDSLATLQAQRAAFPATIRDDGFNPLLDYVALARTDGYFALFRQRGLEYARRLKGGKWPADPRATASHRAVERLLALARGNGIRVEMAIYPYHAQIFGLLDRYGLLPAFAAWQAAMGDTVNRAAAAGTAVRLWDFALADESAAEAIPAPRDRQSTTRWYWEAGHFKAALGDRMLERMLSPASSAGFGRLMGPATGTPAELGERLQAVLREHPDEARDVIEIVRATR